MKINSILILFVAACSLSLFAACRGNAGKDGDEHAAGEKHPSGEIEFSPQQARAAGVEVESLQPSPFSQVINAGGELLAAQGDEAVIAAPAGGMAIFPHGVPAEGSAVSRGQVLFVVSAKNMAGGDAVARAQAEYEAARAAEERASSLARDKIVTPAELEAARLRLAQARTTLDGLGGGRSGGVAVTAPMSGYIKYLSVKPGQYVEVGEAAGAVTQNRRLQLRALVPQRCYSMLNQVSGANFKVSYDDRIYRLDSLNGRLLSFGKSSTGEGRYIPVLFELDNRGNLLPGSYADVFLLSTPRAGVLSVPNEALTEEQGLYFVYLQLDEECYRKQEVALGGSDGVRTEVVKGLKAGDRVVTKGAHEIKLASVSSVVPEGHTHAH